MKYLSLCLLTTGSNPSNSDVLEIGMIKEDSKNPLSYKDSPKLRLWVDKEFYRGSPAGLIINTHIFQKIQELRNSKSTRLTDPEKVFTKIGQFLKKNFYTVKTHTAQPVNLPGFGMDVHAHSPRVIIEEPKEIPILASNWNSAMPFLRRFKDFDSIPFSKNPLTPMLIDWENDDFAPSFEDIKNRLNLEDDDSDADDSLKVAWDNIRVMRTLYNKK